MLVVKFSQIAYDFSYQVFGSVRVSEENGREYELTISEGESTMRVAAKLEQNRIIVNRFSFFLRAKLMKKNILPGTYNVNASMDYDEIYAVIAPAAQPNWSRQGREILTDFLKRRLVRVFHMGKKEKET